MFISEVLKIIILSALWILVYSLILIFNYHAFIIIHIETRDLISLLITTINDSTYNLKVVMSYQELRMNLI